MTVETRVESGHRDFAGYAGAPPDPRWPGGAKVALSFVVNFEEGAELRRVGRRCAQRGRL